MWSKQELETKESIEHSARVQLEMVLEKWWEEQEENKKKDKEYNIIPFLIWKKRITF